MPPALSRPRRGRPAVLLALASPGLAALIILTLPTVTPAGAARAASAERELRLPAVKIYGSASDSPGPVAFSHESHAAYENNRCLRCHPQPFSILGRGSAPAHKEIDAGHSCGRCHNGRDASDARDRENCLSCHATSNGGES